MLPELERAPSRRPLLGNTRPNAPEAVAACRRTGGRCRSGTPASIARIMASHERKPSRISSPTPGAMRRNRRRGAPSHRCLPGIRCRGARGPPAQPTARTAPVEEVGTRWRRPPHSEPGSRPCRGIPAIAERAPAVVHPRARFPPEYRGDFRACGSRRRYGSVGVGEL